MYSNNIGRGNIINGGLITKYKGSILYIDMEKYTGLYQIEKDKSERIWDDTMWFMNISGDNIFFSSQINDNGLYKLDINLKKTQCITKDAAWFLQIIDDYIYYLNENEDFYLYRISINGTNRLHLPVGKCTMFILNENAIYVSKEDGIYRYNHIGKNPIRISDIRVGEFLVYNKEIFFTDLDKNHCLGKLSIETGEVQLLNREYTSNINIFYGNVFFINHNDDSSIYRISIDGKDKIKFINEKADYLHILDNYLIYTSIEKKRNWCRVPLIGGRPTTLIER